mmetsp:Transcript_3190/g.7481  ORF Transcript_3190/g.7481 Transcript_3190/m.7481 type:complete len:207 (-) Transcript_3190:444-1064(-)
MVTRLTDLKSSRSKMVSRISFVGHSKPYLAKVRDSSSLVICLSGRSFIKHSKASLMVLNFSSRERRNSSMAPRAPTWYMTPELRRGDKGLRMEAGCAALIFKPGALPDSLILGPFNEARRPKLSKSVAIDWRLPCRPLETSSFAFLGFRGNMRCKTSATNASVGNGSTSSAFFFSRRRRFAFSVALAFSADVGPPKLSLNWACWKN